MQRNSDLASAGKLEECGNAFAKLLHQRLLTNLPQVSSSLDAHVIQLIPHFKPHTCMTH